MTDGPEGEGRAAFGQKSAELAVAAFFFVIGAVVIADSLRLGTGWQEVHGPRPGYFPFYLGLIMCAASLINAARALLAKRAEDKAFVEVGQLRLVLTVLVPTAVYAGLVSWIGIYVASFLYIALFMRWLGKYPWWKAAAVPGCLIVVFFVVFENWFKVSLPKGPLENLLGLG